eukprot:4446469-Amphidinium_carterae.1
MRTYEAALRPLIPPCWGVIVGRPVSHPGLYFALIARCHTEFLDAVMSLTRFPEGGGGCFTHMAPKGVQRFSIAARRPLPRKSTGVPRHAHSVHLWLLVMVYERGILPGVEHSGTLHASLEEFCSASTHRELGDIVPQ